MIYLHLNKKLQNTEPKFCSFLNDLTDIKLNLKEGIIVLKSSRILCQTEEKHNILLRKY